MHGAGIKLAITTNNPPARVLDLTRLLSRAGRVFTGVDRVELAYLARLCREDIPSFALLRSSLGYVLLDRAGMVAFHARLIGEVKWGEADRLSRLSRKASPEKRRAESDLRRIALDRCRPRHLAKMLRKHLPAHIAYLNVGHSNFTERMIFTMKHALAAQIAVFVHDTIPVDFPQFQRPASVPKFRAFLRRVQHQADVILCNSEATKADIMRNFDPNHPAPEITVAHLGLSINCSEIPNNPALDLPQNPYFLCLGTIEPRKNHRFLFDVWEHLHRDLPAHDMPHLVIIGARGWQNQEVFDLLDHHPMMGRFIHEKNDVGDADLSAALHHAKALLFPSFAEGFGIPALEARAMNVPIICNTLPVMRETLGDIAVYAEVSDSYLWVKAIRDILAHGGKKQHNSGALPPFTWDDHFNLALKVT